MNSFNFLTLENLVYIEDITLMVIFHLRFIFGSFDKFHIK